MSVGSTAVSAEEIDLDFLPLVYQYIRCIEKEQGASDLNRVSVEATAKLTELNSKIATAREQVPKLVGTENKPEDQLKKLEALRQQLIQKKKLIMKYRSKAVVDTSNSM